MDKAQIKELISQMTLEEKAALTSGRDNWYTKGLERLGIQPVRMSDGPHGLRTQAGDVNTLDGSETARAVCFPAACATGASFDADLIEEMGHELGKEAQALNVNVLLGPGVNIKRSPLCGRNFEYFSEDPLLSGVMGAAYIKGVQAEGAGTSLKHFFANSQETRRMDASSEIDERAMHEIYLPAFERAVQDAKPWTVMASYNKIGGVYSTANKPYLTDLLRNTWGYQGLVVSDWGATHDRAAAVAAGTDVTMPAEDTDDQIVQAVREGRLKEADLDASVARVLELAFKAKDNARSQEFDYERGHALARHIAGESMVLLKNERNILPLKPGQKLAFIGAFAKSPRYQGGGSSHIRPSKVVSALDAAEALGLDVTYSPGYNEDGSVSIELLEAAEETAKAVDVAVVFVGLTEAMESEGMDRAHMCMPEGHNALVEAVCAANPHTVVVLHNGSPVETPWRDKPMAILEAYLAGQAVGEAMLDVLTGAVNPSGHLPESFPIRLEDNPSFLTYFGEGDYVPYAEGLFVGYRYYESKSMPVAWPFGFGLSYTNFIFERLTLSKTEIDEGEKITACVLVRNTGDRAGKAVVQLYIAPEKVEMIRPKRELKAFTKIELAPGESKTVELVLDGRAFAYWNRQVHAWRTESGKFAVQIGLNARDIVLEETVTIHAEPVPPVGGYTAGTAMSEFVKSPKGFHFLDENIHFLIEGMAQIGLIPKEILGVVSRLPGKLNLAAIEMLASKAGSTAGGASGLKVLLDQPLGTLMNFMPQEKRDALTTLINELN
ncbi:MAG: glycoside hydrolase family 3 C-terminal domain-containing protein [Acidaminococcaceae bacterium]|nr:glycoside hydrolase family 3 C-terminal domain-containing protein [Acidaminococcaceae bacterium]